MLTSLGGDKIVKSTRLKVLALNSSGKEFELRANEEGLVYFEPETIGVHAIVVSGRNGFAAVPFFVPDPTAIEVPSTETYFQLPLTDIRLREADRIWKSYGNSTFSSLPIKDPRASDSKANASATLNSRIAVGEDGSVQGKLEDSYGGRNEGELQPMNLFVYRESRLLERTVSDRSGIFMFRELEPGNYGLIAAGASGFVALGLEIYAEPVKLSAKSGGQMETYVSMNAIESQSPLPISLIPASMVSIVAKSLQSDEMLSPTRFSLPTSSATSGGLGGTSNPSSSGTGAGTPGLISPPMGSGIGGIGGQGAGGGIVDITAAEPGIVSPSGL